MRLLHTFASDRDARTFSSFLTQQLIANKLEISTDNDWGSDAYGTLQCLVWIIDEDDLEEAEKWLDLYLTNPNDKRFEYLRPTAREIPEPLLTESQPRIKIVDAPLKTKPQTIGPVTMYLIIACTVIFLFSQFSSPSFVPSKTAKPLPALNFSSTAERTLLYDYPQFYEYLNKFLTVYSLDKLSAPETLPPEGKYLYTKLEESAFWPGLYTKVVRYLNAPLEQKTPPFSFSEPMFEKIKQGQYWRLFTPCLMHNDVFHLLFNMIWLLVMGHQIEKRVGAARYILFILLTGAVSNTAQYLMSGASFMGISGVICAMIAFVWFRQQKAPWEGYQIQAATMGFITIFVFAMALIQAYDFMLVTSGHAAQGLQIANTAHIIGGISGYLLSKMRLFSWKPRT